MAKQAGARENPIVALQRYIGNQGVQRLLQRVKDEADLDASDGVIEFPVDHVPTDDGGYENQGPPSPDSEADLDASDGVIEFPVDHVPMDGGGYENQGPPSPDSEADLDASDGHIEFPVDHVPVGGAAVGPVVNEDNIGVPNPVGPTLAGDNLAAPSFDWF